MKIFAISINDPYDAHSVWTYSDENRGSYFTQFCEAGRDVCFDIEVDDHERTRVIKALVELEAARRYSLA